MTRNDNTIRQQRNADNESDLRGALLTCPSNVDLHKRLGKLLIDEDRPKDALPILRKSLAIRPSDREIITLTAGVLQLLNRDEEAIRLMNEKIPTDPGCKEFHHLLACLYARIDRSAEAVSEFEKALEIDPADVRVRNDLAALYLIDGMLDEAVSEFRKVLEYDPGNEEAVMSLDVIVRECKMAGGGGDMVKKRKPAVRKLPPEVLAKADELKAMTGAFCDLHMDEEMRGLCEKLIEKMGRKKEVPFMRGKIGIWAAAVIYALAQINFLFDKNSRPCRTSPDEICEFFQVNKATVSFKASQIRGMVRMSHYDEEFSKASVSRESPNQKYAMINGVIVNVSLLEEKPERPYLNKASPLRYRSRLL